MDFDARMASSALQLEQLSKLKSPTAYTIEAINQSIEENRKNTVAAIEANRQLSDAAIRANKEIADKGVVESKRSSNIALLIAVPSLFLTIGSLLFAYSDSKESKAWMESELIELKTANTKLAAINADYSKVIEFQEKQLKELKTMVSELKRKGSR